MGVDVFFVLSGFLITDILLNTKATTFSAYLSRFYRRRVRRILPPYILLLATTSALFGLFWLRHWYLYLGFMNVYVAFPISHPSTLDPLWSLAVEEQFYLVWPLAVFFVSESSLAWIAALLMVIAPALRWTFTPLFQVHWAIYSLSPFRMDLLAAGALIAIAWRHRASWFQRYGHFGLVLSAAAVAALLRLSKVKGFSTHANTQAANLWIYELSLLTCVGVMVWVLSGRGVWMLRLSPVRYIGRVSYSLYLIHETALALARRLPVSQSYAALCAAVISIGYAAVSWQIIEGPLSVGKSGKPAEFTL